MRIAINGFGRIGRTILRQILTLPEHADIDVVLVNDIAPLDSCAYLFKYDSTFGPLPLDVIEENAGLRIGGRFIPFTSRADLGGSVLSGVDVLLECTGKVHAHDTAAHGLNAGAGAVLISGPSDFADQTIVIGANDSALGNARIVSNSSCTTNAIAPLLHALQSSVGVLCAHVTTVHCYTSSQPLVDTPRANLARSRAGAESMVPTTTSAARELQGILPGISDLVSVAALRVPCLSVSAIDMTVQIEAPLEGDAQTFVQTLAERSPVIGATRDPCVSRDMRGRPESLVLALPETQAIGDTQLRIFGWYDNEWGFSARMIDMARRITARG